MRILLSDWHKIEKFVKSQKNSLFLIELTFFDEIQKKQNFFHFLGVLGF